MRWFHILARVQGVTALVVVLCIMMAAIMLFNDHRMLPRKDAPADPLFMMDPEEVRYKEEFLCRKYVILDRVVSFDQSRGHCRTKSGKQYTVSRSHLAIPAPG